MRNSIPALVLAAAFCCSACNNDKKGAAVAGVAAEKGTSDAPASSGAAWSGRLVTEFAGSIRYYDFDSKEESKVFDEAWLVSVAPDGQVVSLSSKFAKRNHLIQTADPAFNSVQPVLEIPERFYGGYVHGVKVSPDGGRLAVSYSSYSGYELEKDATVIYDRQGTVLAKFEGKYQPDWLSDGRLVMAGSLRAESSDNKVTDGPEPGIYLVEKDLATVRRIDPNLNNPAPVNVAASPDGRRVAFIRNNHLWVMNTDGSDLRQLTAPGGDNEESFPAWSPDGKLIAMWCYKTFEKTYYTAIAIVPADAATPIKLENEAPVWPRDKDGDRVSGGAHQIVWLKQ